MVLSSKQRPEIKGYKGRVCLVLPSLAIYDTIYVVVPKDDTSSLNMLRESFPLGNVVAEGPLYHQQPYFLTYRPPAGAEAQAAPTHRIEANWEDKTKLLGYDLDTSTYKAGETIHLTLYYQGLDKVETNYTVFTHLLGPCNPTLSGSLWGAGR